MGSVSSDDELDRLSERFDFDSYSLSADVSESESSTDFSYRHYYDHRHGGASTSSPPPQLLDGFISPPPLLHIMRPVAGAKHIVIPARKEDKPETELSEVEIMKARFSRLLLGEDMLGGGNGVCTALAISNAITNLSASVFGELWKLEPLSPQKKSMWNREMELLLCVSDSIVELVPSNQDFPGSGTFEVMVPRPRLDLFVNLPALKKLDAMLLNILDGFSGSEFYYVDRGVIVSGGDETQTFTLSSSSARLSISNEKWWLPFPKVPQNGLSEDTRKRLQQCKEFTNQIFKAAMAINSNVLTEMEVPNAYLESLPKSGKACLGEDIYRHVTTKRFSPDSLLDYLDLSSEYSMLDVANRIEAAAHIWRKKYLKGHSIHERAGKRSTWSGRVKGLVSELERSKLLARRAEILLDSLRLRFPALPQTTLDANKIQCNKDVGHAIIESYSRVIESLAFNMISRIDDLLYVDDATKQRAAAELASWYDQGRLGVGAHPKRDQMSLGPVSFRHSFSAYSSPLRTFDSTDEKTRTPHGRGDHFTEKGKIRNSPVQILKKLTF